jgi:hypothetical protein
LIGVFSSLWIPGAKKEDAIFFLTPIGILHILNHYAVGEHTQDVDPHKNSEKFHVALQDQGKASPILTQEPEPSRSIALA